MLGLFYFPKCDLIKTVYYVTHPPCLRNDSALVLGWSCQAADKELTSSF